MTTTSAKGGSPAVLLFVATLVAVGAVAAFVMLKGEPRPPVAANATAAPTHAASTTTTAKEAAPAAAPPKEPEVDASTGLVKADGWELVAANCTACHSAKLVTQNRGDRQHWLSMIRWMQQTQNLWPLAPEVEDKLLSYLSTHYGAKGFARRAPLPAHLMPPDPAKKSAALGARVEEAKAALAPLKQQLMGALKGALDEGGPMKAVDVCQLKAPAIAAGASHDGVTVGRTSHKLRSPDNAPRAWMKPLLEEYASGPKAPGSFKTVELEGGGLGYVEPIYVQPMCLSCHGAELAPEVSSAIAARYPGDQATGFREGDFRGLFWVELPPARP